MNKNNAHKKPYDFKLLTEQMPNLAEFVFTNQYGTETIDFANPKAVKALNTALLKAHYKIEYWSFPDDNLCPPIPGRVEYIHLLNDLLKTSGINENITILDLGTGATCIYPLLGNAEYGWKFIASETDKPAFKTAEKIVKKNSLENAITLRFQDNHQHILTGILKPSEQISASMCNPPFFKDEAEAEEKNLQKLKGLGSNANTTLRNFSGTAKELCYPGGEKAYLHNYLYQSSLLKTNCFWYTSLVSKHALVKSMQASLKKLGATQIKVLEMKLGNKVSRVVAWTFLSEEAQKKWNPKK
ncbi:23S rRNA (adenine(1618)-N(6))-methyltransferase RlmF [Subsaximicrobium wynnwilliamsii]|uniref:23S rRNA (Adenine(1618)-N(6))-methyltransferase RlmF n=1 Tax=Subsaximicrobium wynnwilliamsii TaxID=291179 RepID=A0A5C6ZKT5_9FLAO|nr:23S rRNA (adenine(1618)-N(6))-methyltransferase RlmF [Subsaximicrobium wynnwilliamsii]TXD84781.1 23S rRNA (adenine(1618)-N(6))-methyltransferase RlmF [Subsaximicrobium wynnwilliamsii]TXD90452.1 23S rRNA (adenine(1618)-N(6))-methyltransferase RlmF [Subsaximicrobium wynnwilliamsii]TXE04928.1 23S rRNA (adenine(1618)-N(6))-methyltransferase RlmF [Subsaximicrobium wynnwilliamsii]